MFPLCPKRHTRVDHYKQTKLGGNPLILSYIQAWKPDPDPGLKRDLANCNPIKDKSNPSPGHSFGPPCFYRSLTDKRYDFNTLTFLNQQEIPLIRLCWHYQQQWTSGLERYGLFLSSHHSTLWGRGQVFRGERKHTKFINLEGIHNKSWALMMVPVIHLCVKYVFYSVLLIEWTGWMNRKLLLLQISVLFVGWCGHELCLD